MNIVPGLEHSSGTIISIVPMSIIMFYATEVHFHVIPGLFDNIRKSGNIWGGDFYRSWTVKLTLPALTLEQFMSFNVQVR